MIRNILLTLIAAGLISLSACAGAAGEQTVSGTVTYLQRSALPPDAIVKVALEDISLADAPATVLSEQTIKSEGKQVPIPYSLPYDPQDIQENHTYRVAARIEDGSGKLLFISDTVVPVITRGNPTQEVEIVVVPAN